MRYEVKHVGFLFVLCGVQNWFNNRRRKDIRKDLMCLPCRYFRAPLSKEQHDRYPLPRPCFRYFFPAYVSATNDIQQQQQQQLQQQQQQQQQQQHQQQFQFQPQQQQQQLMMSHQQQVFEISSKSHFLVTSMATNWISPSSHP